MSNQIVFRDGAGNVLATGKLVGKPIDLQQAIERHDIRWERMAGAGVDQATVDQATAGRGDSPAAATGMADPAAEEASASKRRPVGVR